MYTKDTITRYADSLTETPKAALLNEISTIRFAQGGQICVARECEKAFMRAGLMDLYGDLRDRIFEFMTDKDAELMQKM